MTSRPQPWRVAAATITVTAVTAAVVAVIAGITHMITGRWSPLPEQPPWAWSASDIADWFASDATGADATTVATQILAVVAYVMVAVIAAGLFAELIDQSRHGIATQPARRTRRSRRWRPTFTASLVALLLGATTLTTTATAIGLPERAPISVTVNDHTPSRHATPPPEQAASAEAVVLPAGMRWGTYTVQRADESLRSIATTISGDPVFTRTIWDANQHRHVTPTDTLTDPTIVRAGWTLTVPVPTMATADRIQHQPAPTSDDTAIPATHLVVVEPGDNLYRLIDDVVDEPQPEDVDAVAHANDGTATSDGTFVFHASNPNLIHPGQTFDLQPAIDLDLAQTAPPAIETVEAVPPPVPLPDPPVEAHQEPSVAEPAEVAPAPLPTAAPVAEADVAAMPVPTVEQPNVEAGPLPAPPSVVTMPAPPIPIPAHAIPPSPTQPGDVAPTPTSQPADSPQASDESAPVPALAAGGLALAGLLFALDRRRRRNRTHRPIGHTIDPPDEPLATSERILRGAAHLDRAQRTNLALRQLAPALANRAAPLRARHLLVDDTIRIVFDRPALPPPGWIADTNDHTWVCTLTDDDLTLTEHEPNPWPAVVPIGTLDDGTDVLIDLEAHGIVTITGAGAPSVISALVTAIASSPYTELLTLLDPDTVQLHGLAPLLEHRLAVPDTNDIINRLTTWIAPFHSHDTHLLAARHQWGTELEPCIAAITTTLDDQQRQQLDALPLDGTQPIAIITTDTQLDATTLSVDADGTTQLDDLHVHCHRLEPVAAATATALHHHADRLTTSDTTPLQQYRTETETDTDRDSANVNTATSTDTEPADAPIEQPGADLALPEPDELQLFDTDPHVDWTIKLLGPLEITHTDGYALTTPRARELLTLLALHPNGLTKQQLEDRLWPLGDNHQPAGGAGLTPRLSELRKALGNGDTARGRTYLPVHTNTRGYHVTGVEADSHRFFALIDAANRTTGQDKINALAGALHLVRGQIGSGEITAYSWINHHLDTIEAGVVDAGLELGQLALAQHNYKLADWAATQIRLASPYEQRAIPIAIAARRELGDTVGIRRLHDDATGTMDQLEPDVQHAFQQALAT